MNWQRLDLLGHRFVANCDALASRDAEVAARLREHRPAALYAVASAGDQIHIARVHGTTADVVPHRLQADGAHQIVQKLCPTEHYTDPILVAGIDQGWLWQFLYRLPVHCPLCPGHRPPLFLLVREIEELWVAAHVHDWRELLADARVRLFVGEDAYDQLQRALLGGLRLALPRLSVTLDPACWPAGKDLDGLTADCSAALNVRLAGVNDKLKAVYAAVTDQALAAKFRSGAKLRVMGITARYTTFLQHSMRDWLAAFESAGHDTRLLIEHADHERLNSLVIAETAAEFRPDLILLIDHFRAELGGLPERCPAVMWVQDFLPNIFAPTAGAAQGPYDYVIGFNQVECTTRFGYPRARFMPAVIPVNEHRFVPVELSEEQRRRFSCDVSYVSHASAPPEAILQTAIEQNGPEVKPLLVDAFERLKAVYDKGRFLTHPLHVRGLIEQACFHTRTAPSADSLQRLVDLFTNRINNAFFRHQALDWTAELDVELHIYGNGWEKHPRLARYAKGPADNAKDLRHIFSASRINLQATPNGIVHQRLLEGVASGGFFLARYVAGDVVDRLYKPIWAWCRAQGIESDEQLLQRATPDVFRLLGELQRTLGLDPFKLGMQITDDMRHSYDIDYVRSPAFWPEYDQISFDSRHALQQRVTHFLAHPDEREVITRALRQRVLADLTYKATNRRMLDFLATDLASRSKPQEIAA